MRPSDLVDAVWITALRRLSNRRAMILGYHGVADCPRQYDQAMLQLPPARFRAQIELMHSAGFRFVTVAELVRRASGGPPSPGLAAVTFDDAMRNVLTEALPILAEFQIPATVYAVTDWLGGRSPWIGPNGDGALLTADELRQLGAAGWEIGSHTVTHADLSRLDYESCRREIDESCKVLESLTGEPVQTLAYPFGHHGAVAVAAVRDAGLLAAVATCSRSWQPYELTRAMIGSADPFPIVLLRMTDRCDAILRSRPLRLVRRATEHLGARRRSSGRKQ